MNFKQLAAFREVMLTGSISEAARNLSRTQPAISAQISGLEDEIGLKLFVRQGARVHPNPEAQYLFDEANSILDRLETVKKTLEDISDLQTGVLRIVSIPGPSVFFLPNIIADFVKQKPGVRVTLSSRSSIQAQRSISTQEYDVGLADFGSGKAVDSRLINHTVIEFQGLCALLESDPLAQKDVIHARDLDGKPIAASEKSHPIHTYIQSSFDEAKSRLNCRFETLFFLPALQYVERGLAYAIVDPICAESYQFYNAGKQRIVFRPFLPTVQISLTVMSPVHRPLSSIAQAFLEELTCEARRVREIWDF